MSDKANCKNCIHFDEIKRRCCLNDDSWVQKECYFRRNNRKPMGNDVIFEKQGEIIKDLQSQLDQQKAMWNELKEWVRDNTYICGGDATREDIITSSSYNQALRDVLDFMETLQKEYEK